MKIAIDVHYREGFAKSVSIEFQNWDDPSPSKINEKILPEVEAYISGEFYKRELPCILEILKETKKEDIELIIVDGYVVLDDQGRAGLGMYLYEALGTTIPIIGVAKKEFKANKKKVSPILRGESQNPLYVTSVGIDLKEAAEKIKGMYGDYRMPDLLRILDRRTKDD